MYVNDVKTGGTFKLPRKGDKAPNGRTVVFSDPHRTNLSEYTLENAEKRLEHLREVYSDKWHEVAWKIFTDGNMFGVERWHYKTD